MIIRGVINFEIPHSGKQNEVIEMSPEWGLKYLQSFLFKEMWLSSERVSCVHLTGHDRNVVMMQNLPSLQKELGDIYCHRDYTTSKMMTSAKAVSWTDCKTSVSAEVTVREN